MATALAHATLKPAMLRHFSNVSAHSKVVVGPPSSSFSSSTGAVVALFMEEKRLILAETCSSALPRPSGRASVATSPRHLVALLAKKQRLLSMPRRLPSRASCVRRHCARPA
eukprot:2937126-Alexandrium_andersonii.AAC.1